MEKQPQISREHYQKMKDAHKVQEDAFIDTAHVEALKENEAHENTPKKEFSLEIKLPIETIEVGCKSGDELIAELTKANIDMSDYMVHLLKDKKIFPSVTKTEQVNLVILDVQQLGFKQYETILREDLINRAKEFCLEPCPIDTAPYWVLSLGDSDTRSTTFISDRLYSDPSDEWSVFRSNKNDSHDHERNLFLDSYDWKDSVHTDLSVCFRVSNK